MSRMIEPLDDNPSSAPLAVILLPVAVALHIAEEWFGGFIDWARLVMEVNIEAEQFLAINTIGLVLFVIGCASAYREPRAAWIGVSLAALVGVNAIVHTVLSVAVGEYSPGTITGLLLYVPMSVIIIRWAATHLSRGVVGGAILFGIGIHAVATLSAIL
jgi:hypothetical protein